jgi:hypothetical protein
MYAAFGNKLNNDKSFGLRPEVGMVDYYSEVVSWGRVDKLIYFHFLPLLLNIDRQSLLSYFYSLNGLAALPKTANNDIILVRRVHSGFYSPTGTQLQIVSDEFGYISHYYSLPRERRRQEGNDTREKGSIGRPLL